MFNPTASEGERNEARGKGERKVLRALYFGGESGSSGKECEQYLG